MKHTPKILAGAALIVAITIVHHMGLNKKPITQEWIEQAVHSKTVQQEYVKLLKSVNNGNINTKAQRDSVENLIEEATEAWEQELAHSLGIEDFEKDARTTYRTITGYVKRIELIAYKLQHDPNYTLEKYQTEYYDVTRTATAAKAAFSIFAQEGIRLNITINELRKAIQTIETYAKQRYTKLTGEVELEMRQAARQSHARNLDVLRTWIDTH